MTRVEKHLDLFNSAVRSGQWAEFVDAFAEDAVMRFVGVVGVPAGPFHGRTAIAEAYVRQPPTDTMRVESVRTDGGYRRGAVAWTAGGTGTDDGPLAGGQGRRADRGVRPWLCLRTV